MHLTVLKVAFACLIVGVSAQRVEIPHKHFTTLGEAVADAEQYILKFNETFNFPSLAFGMAVRGKPVIRKAWGRADLENSVAAKLSTKYRLGMQRRRREGQINFCLFGARFNYLSSSNPISFGFQVIYISHSGQPGRQGTGSL